MKFDPKKHPYLIACGVGLILSLIAVWCATLPLRGIRQAVESMGASESVSKVLLQLAKAAVRPKWLLALPGALLTGLPIRRLSKAKKTRSKILCILTIALLLIVLWAVSVFTMTVSSVSFGTALRILIRWIMGGGLSDL